ncbi:MAG: hypothetical protein DWQ07_18845 [Chloroflexi bacterium]|nr:MAG: hypothetical protein DWQ07_18845 [Chloroflexota bacterium]MBL1194991.1 hypothetical protein [Chloroflexota bacterium]NOH12279.1 hypothetical protein [Chloroflexota bacterium]
MKMFTKFFAVIAVMLLAFTASTPALAQGATPFAPGGRGPQGGSFGQGLAGAEGPLHKLIEANLATALGISLEEFEVRRDAGETFSQMALDLGFETDEIFDLMYAAHQTALAQAVEQGLISADQAERMANMGMNSSQGPFQGSANGAGQGNGECLQDGVPLGTGPHGPQGNSNR